MRERTTERGFGVYVTGKDVYGNELSVKQSSLASESAVRIYADNPNGRIVKNYRGEEFPLADCIHVNKEGAELIIKGLQAWLEEERK